jgi:hypothetical protein
MEMPLKTEAVSMKVALSGLAPTERESEGGKGGFQEEQRERETSVDPHAAEQGDESLVGGVLGKQLLCSLRDDRHDSLRHELPEQMLDPLWEETKGDEDLDEEHGII